VLKFTVQDLFVAGIAIDLVGASLLAKSLFKTPHAIAARATEHETFDPAEAVQLCQDKIDGNFGLGYLVSGFTLQAIGYEIVLASAHIGDERGRNVALTALLIALVCAVPLLLAWRLSKHRLVRWQVGKVAEVTRVDPARKSDGRPSLQVLMACAREMHEPRGRDESAREWIQRVFGIKDVYDETAGCSATKHPR
jgi:hypothetical protein